LENSENFKKVVTILAKYKNTDKFKVRVGKNGIGFSIHRDVNDELMKSDIPKNEIENINKKILDVISKKIIENKEPENEVEKYAIDKLYSNEFRNRYLLILTQTNPIFEDIEIISTLKEKDGITSKSYTIKIITIDEKGEPKVIKFECIEENIKKIIDKLNI
jgi:hypothetical protein